MMLSVLIWTLFTALAGFVNGQSTATQWCDPLTNICFWRYYMQDQDASWGYLFPPLAAPGQAQSNEFIGIFTARASAGWIGSSLGGGMRNNPLVVAWTNGNTPVISVRSTATYGIPQPLAGPTVTILGTSGANGTHQRIVYRCQNCVTWTGGTGSIDLNGTATLGYAIETSNKPDVPSNPASNFGRHTIAGQHTLNTANAHNSQYNTYLTQLTNAPPLAPGGPTTPTTTSQPTPTSTVLCPGAPNPSYALTVASGWRVVPVLGRLRTPRGLTVDPRGNLLVVQRGVGVTHHTLDANGCVTATRTLISDTQVNHGIDVNPAGNKLYASSGDIAWVWDYDPVALTATNKRTLITGMNNNYHFTRTLLISRKDPNYMVVTVGSNDNIDMASFRPETGRAAIKVFDLRTLPANGTPFNNSAYGKMMGYGLRNDVGIAEDRAGIVHSIENSLDNAYRMTNGQRRDIHINNPAEKVYKLGTVTSPANIFGGYPYCYTVWEPSDFTDSSKQVGDWFTQDNSGTYTDAWCNTNTVKPILVLPPHTAPLDMKFGVGSDTNMYAGLHGSWNRQPPQGYKVVIVPGNFSASGEWNPSVPLAQTKTSWRDLLTNRNENQCTSGCFRPVGLAFSLNGENLYVASDTSGEVFLLKRNTGPTTTTIGGPTSQPTVPPPVTTSTPPPPVTTPTTTYTPPPTTVAPPQPTQSLWGQCGGNGWTGPTNCGANATCKIQNDYYSQCVPM